MQECLAVLEKLVYDGPTMRQRTPREALEAAIEALGGLVNTARVLRLKDERYQTVQSWLANRVPAEHCPSIERATRAVAAQGGESLIVRCEELRPDVAWEVLRQQEVA